jgi:hypothetical protein
LSPKGAAQFILRFGLSVAPSGLSNILSLPQAYARGYFLAPLWGWETRFATVLHAPRRTQAHENVLSYDFRVSGSEWEAASKFCRIDPDCDTDSDPEIFWYQLLFSEQKLITSHDAIHQYIR